MKGCTFVQFGYYLYIVYILFDFGRIHEMIPGIGSLRIVGIAQLLLAGWTLIHIRKLKWDAIPLWKSFYSIGFLVSYVMGLHVAGTGIIQIEIFRTLGMVFAASIFLDSWRKLLSVQVILVLLSFITAVWVITHGGHGPGWYWDENDVALHLVLLMPLAYFLSATANHKWISALSIFAFVAMLVAVAITLSRGGIVGCLPVLAVICLRSKRPWLSASLIAFAVVVAIALAPPELKSEFISIKDVDEGTAKTRRFFWEISYAMFQERPWTGVGPGNWIWAIWTKFIIPESHVSNITPHSIYFQLLSELGLVGTIPFLGLMLSLAWGLYKTSRPSRTILADASLEKSVSSLHNYRGHVVVKYFAGALLIGLMGSAICGAFLSVLYYPHLYFLAGLAHVTINLQRRFELLALIHTRSSPNEAAAIESDPSMETRAQRGYHGRVDLGASSQGT